jgi:hypothetical protein
MTAKEQGLDLIEIAFEVEYACVYVDLQECSLIL